LRAAARSSPSQLHFHLTRFDTRVDPLLVLEASNAQ
jgi:hypothetical protein